MLTRKRPAISEGNLLKRARKTDECLDDLIKIRKYLGYHDTMHDFLNEQRVKTYVGNEKLARDVIDKIESIFNMDFKCDIGNDEDSILVSVFGNKSTDIPFEKAVQEDLSIITNNTQLTPPYYGKDSVQNKKEFQENSILVEYEKLPEIVRWIDNLIVDESGISKQYVLDYTQISEDSVCNLGSSGRTPEKIVLKTIASKYDRNTDYKDSDCIQATGYAMKPNEIQSESIRVDEKKYFEPLDKSTVLTKEQGELHELTYLQIENENEMTWFHEMTDSRGVIRIQNLTSKELDSKRKKNLNLFVNQIVEVMKRAPVQKAQKGKSRRKEVYKKIQGEYDALIEYLYGLNRDSFVTNKNAYIRCLTDFKKIGDLLLVKMARLNNAVFVSNDRVTCVMAAIGYNVPTIRTSLVQQEKTEDSPREKAHRLLTLYNFRHFMSTEDSKRSFYSKNIQTLLDGFAFYTRLPLDSLPLDDWINKCIMKKNTLKSQLELLAKQTVTEPIKVSYEDVYVTNPNEEIQKLMEQLQLILIKNQLYMYDLVRVQDLLDKINHLSSKYKIPVDSKSLLRTQRQIDNLMRSKMSSRQDLKDAPLLLQQIIPFMDEITTTSIVTQSRTRSSNKGFFNLSYLKSITYEILLEYFLFILILLKRIYSYQKPIEDVFTKYTLKTNKSLNELERAYNFLQKTYINNLIPEPGVVFNQKQVTSIELEQSMTQLTKMIEKILRYDPTSKEPLDVLDEIPLVHYPSNTLQIILHKLNMATSDYIIQYEDIEYTVHIGIMEGSRQSLYEILDSIQEIKQTVTALQTKYVPLIGGSPFVNTPGKSNQKPVQSTSYSDSITPAKKTLVEQMARMSVETPSTPSIQEPLRMSISESDLLQKNIQEDVFVDIFDIFNSILFHDIATAETTSESDDLLILYTQIMFIKHLFGQYIPILGISNKPLKASSSYKPSRS
jgi:hypothetical protein